MNPYFLDARTVARFSERVTAGASLPEAIRAEHNYNIEVESERVGKYLVGWRWGSLQSWAEAPGRTTEETLALIAALPAASEALHRAAGRALIPPAQFADLPAGGSPRNAAPKFYGRFGLGTDLPCAPIYGLSEIAGILGVKPQTVKQWHKRGKLPAPSAHLAAGLVWQGPEIEAWIRERGSHHLAAETT